MFRVPYAIMIENEVPTSVITSLNNYTLRQHWANQILQKVQKMSNKSVSIFPYPRQKHKIKVVLIMKSNEHKDNNENVMYL